MKQHLWPLLLPCLALIGCGPEKGVEPPRKKDRAGLGGVAGPDGTDTPTTTITLPGKGPHQGVLIALAGCPYKLEFVLDEIGPKTASIHILDAAGKSEHMLKEPGGVTITVHRPKGGGVKVTLASRPPKNNPSHRGSFSWHVGGSEVRRGFENRWPMTIVVKEWVDEIDDQKIYTGKLFDDGAAR